ncbi:MFS transporter [Candidatus Latescibacterota bacterium]
MNKTPPEDTDSIKEHPDISINANLCFIFGISLMAVMGVSSIAPAFPIIMDEFALSEWEVGLLISFFTLPGIVFSPVAGILADRLGRKKILVPSLLLFGIAGGACAFARDFRLMLALRFLQGLGATSLGTLNITILGDLFEGRKRTTAIGYNMSVLSIGTACYPAVGGTLAMFGWWYPFLLPLIAIPLGVSTLVFLKNPEPGNAQDFKDYMRSALRSVWKKQALGLFSLGVVTFIVLYGSYLTYFPIMLYNSFDAEPVIIGLIVSTSSIVIAVTSWKIGFFVRRYSEKSIIMTGLAFYALSMVIIPYIPSLWGFVIPTVLFGMGMGLNIPCIQVLMTSLAPIEQRAAVLSLNSMMLRVGQTLGPLLMGVVLVTGGINSVFYVGALLSLFMIVITAGMIK